MKNRKKLAVACAATLGFILGIGGTNAYLTSYDQVVNVVGIGKNTTNIVEEFPTPSPLPGDEDSELPKTVWVANGNVQGEEASVDCYVRVSLGYSNSDIGRAVTLKQIDRTNWVEADDGFYYYKKVLREGEKTTPLFSGISVDSSKLEKTYLDQIDASSSGGKADLGPLPDTAIALLGGLIVTWILILLYIFTQIGKKRRRNRRLT